MNYIKYIPSILSLIRIIAFPFIALCILYDYFLAGLMLFSGAAFTDYLDGWYARRYHVVSAVGAFLDPLADKVLMLGTFATFSVINFFPVWMVVVISAREFLITLCRVRMMHQKRTFTTSSAAKLKTVLQMLLVYLLFIKRFFLHNSLYLLLFNACCFIVIGVTMYSALHYCLKIMKKNNV